MRRTRKEATSEIRAMQTGVPDIVRRCVEAKTHLTQCDDDGYCNFCGHQDGPSFDGWPYDQEG